jgi:hypothetical protein
MRSAVAEPSWTSDRRWEPVPSTNWVVSGSAVEVLDSPTVVPEKFGARLKCPSPALKSSKMIGAAEAAGAAPATAATPSAARIR